MDNENFGLVNIGYRRLWLMFKDERRGGAIAGLKLNCLGNLAVILLILTSHKISKSNYYVHS